MTNPCTHPPPAQPGASHPPATWPRTRVAVFGSFYRGLHVLQTLLHGPLSSRVQVVGVATDDPSQTFVSPHKRVWQYPHAPHEETMVQQCAQDAGIGVYRGRVKTPAFYELYETVWQPDVCIMATFGQRIDTRLHQFPKLGFFNLHPCIDDTWPSRYVGGNPFDALRRDGHCHARIALHHVDDDFDTGALVAYSEQIDMPAHASVVDLHRLTAPIAAALMAQELGKLLPPAHTEADRGVV